MLFYFNPPWKLSSNSSSSSAANRRVSQTKSPKRRGPRRSGPLVVRKFWNVDSMNLPNLNAVRPSDNQVHRFTYTSDAGTVLTTSVTVPAQVGINFQLTNIPNSATLIALFDQYRIARIEAWLQPQSANNGGHSGMLFSAIDYDNDTALTPTQLQAYSNTMVAPAATTGHYHSWVPHIASGAYSGTFAGFKNDQAPWIDVSSPTVRHYGLLIASAITTDVITIDLIVRYHLEFRNTL